MASEGDSSGSGTGNGTDGSDSSYRDSFISIIDWLSGIAEKITSIPTLVVQGLGLDTLFSNLIDTVVNLPDSIGEYINSFKSSVSDKLESLKDAILGIPDLIIDGYIRIFVPDEAVIDSHVAVLTRKVESLGISAYDMTSIFSDEKTFSDIDATIMGVNVTLVDMSFINSAVLKFRPVLRGFIWLMLCFYNFNQFLGLIGQQSITLGGMVSFVKGVQQE